MKYAKIEQNNKQERNKNMLGDKLRIARQQKGWTQSEVAKETYIPQTTLSKIENNIYEPNIEQLQKLIELYDINANWLLDVGMNRKV